MFKDNFAQYFRKTRYELKKKQPMFDFWPLKIWKKIFFSIFFFQKQNGHHFPKK